MSAKPPKPSLQNAISFVVFAFIALLSVVIFVALISSNSHSPTQTETSPPVTSPPTTGGQATGVSQPSESGGTSNSSAEQAGHNEGDPQPQKETRTEAQKSLDAMSDEIDAQFKREAAVVDKRISLRRRKQIYYAATKALNDEFNNPTGHRETKETVAEVCHKYHITYETEEIIRQEGIDEGWPAAQ